MRWLPLALILALAGIGALVAAEELTIDPIHWYDTVPPGVNVTIDYSFEYTNGTPNATVIIALTYCPTDWAHNLTAWVNGTLVTHPSRLELQVANNSRGNFTLGVGVSRTARAYTHFLDLHAYLEERPSVYAEASLSFWVPYAPGVALNLSDPAQDGSRVRPGELLELELELTNTGNQADQFQLDARATGPGSGWRAFFSEGVGDAQWTPRVSPGKTHPLAFVVLVPYSAMADEHIELAFTVYTMADPTFSATPLCVTIYCALTGDLEVVGSWFSDDGLDPTDFNGGRMTMECTVGVRNLGNGDDVVHTEAHISGLEEAGLVIVGVQQNPLRIGAGLVGDFAFDISVALDAPAGKYLMWFFFASTDPSAREMLETTITVNSSRVVLVECATPVLSARPMEDTDFILSVRNVGNTDEDLTLSVETALSTWFIRLTPASVRLSQGTEQTVYVTVHVPQLTGTVLSTRYPLTVVVKGFRGARMASSDLAVELLPTHRVEWAVDGHPVTSWDSTYARDDVIYPRPAINPFHANGTWASEMLSVVNLGNVEANVSLIPWIVPQGVGVSFEPSSVTLAPGADAPVEVRILVSGDLSPGPYTLSVAMTCGVDPDFRTRVLPIRFSVFNIDIEVVTPLRVRFDLLWTSGSSIIDMEMYETVAVEGTVRNLCDFDVRPLKVTLLHIGPDGVQEVLSTRYPGLPARESAVCNFSWDADAPGEHQLGVIVYLDDQSRSDNDAAWVTVNVEGEPVDAGGAFRPAELSEPVSMALAAVAGLFAFLALRFWTASHRRTGREGTRHYRKRQRG